MQLRLIQRVVSLEDNFVLLLLGLDLTLDHSRVHLLHGDLQAQIWDDITDQVVLEFTHRYAIFEVTHFSWWAPVHSRTVFEEKTERRVTLFPSSPLSWPLKPGSLPLLPSFIFPTISSSQSLVHWQDRTSALVWSDGIHWHYALC